MADLSKMSDEELMKAAGISAPSQDSQPSDLSHLSDEELMKAAGVQQKPQPAEDSSPSMPPQSIDEAKVRIGAGLNLAKKLFLRPLGIPRTFGEELGTELATPGAGKAVALHSGQGATLGFSDEGAAGLTAATGGNYKNSRDQMRREIDETARSHPMLSALSELVGAAPLALATAGISEFGPLGRIALNTTQAGVYGLGTSKKESIKQTAKDVAGPAALAAGLSALAEGPALKSLIKDKYKTYYNPELGQEVVDKANINNIPKVTRVENGDLEIQFPTEGQKLKAALKIGVDEAKPLTNPKVQAKIEDKLTDLFGTETRPGRFPQVIDETKFDLGLARDKILDKVGSQPLKVGSTFNDVIEGTSKITSGGVADIEPAKTAFMDEVITPMWQKFQKASPTQNLDDVPLSVILEEKQALGEQLFGKKQLFKKAPEVRDQAIKLYNGFNTLMNKADPALETFNNAFSALYQTEDNFINSLSKLKKLSDPNAGSARSAYRDLIEPFSKLDPNMRAANLPKVQQFITEELPDTLLLSDVKNEAIKAQKSDGIKQWMLNRSPLTQSGRYNALSSVGSRLGQAKNLAAGAAALPGKAAGLAENALMSGSNEVLRGPASIPSLSGALQERKK